MSAFNNLVFRHKCPECHESNEFKVQFKACSSYGGNAKIDRFHDWDYRIGDTMPWHDEPEERNSWPSEYCYVSQLNPDGGPKYVIDSGLGDCPNCAKRLTFYIRVTNRRILRIIGCESADLNDLTVVFDDGRIQQTKLDYDFSLDPPPKS